MQKICSSCNEHKSSRHFYKDKSKKGGYRYSCKECDKLAGEKYKLKTKAYQDQYYLNNKVEILKKAADKEKSVNPCVYRIVVDNVPVYIGATSFFNSRVIEHRSKIVTHKYQHTLYSYLKDKEYIIEVVEYTETIKDALVLESLLIKSLVEEGVELLNVTHNKHNKGMIMSKKEVVEISVDELAALEKAYEELEALKCYGVDNWGGYGDAMESIYGDEE